MMHKLGCDYLLEKDKMEVYLELATTVISKLVHVFIVNQKFTLALNSLKAIFKK